MPISPPLFPQNITKINLLNPKFLQPRIGELPDGLISLKILFWSNDGTYGFDTLDLSRLPPSLRELMIVSKEPSFRLTGVLPVGLQNLYTSNHLIVDCHVPASVAHDTG
jgi:hypothetical protein